MNAMLTQGAVPIVVRVIAEPTPQVGPADVLIKSIGITGLLLLGSLFVGLALGALFIWYRRRWPDNVFNGQSSEQASLRLSARPDA
jgi:hypothetical protein